MITHLTPENERLLKNMKSKLHKLERSQKMIAEHKAVSKKYASETHDNYGIFDIFKSKENRYSAVCGEVPVQADTESPEDFAKRQEAYSQCIAQEDAKFTNETQQQTTELGQTATTLESWYKNVTGGQSTNPNQPLYQGEAGAVYLDDGSKEETIFGMPKIAFYTLATLVGVLVLYIMFFKGKK